MQQLLGGPRQALVDDLGQAAAAALVREVLSLEHGASLRHGVDVLDVSGRLQSGVDLPVEDGEVVWAFRPPEGVDSGGNEQAEVRRTGRLQIGPTLLPVGSYRFRPWTEMQAAGGRWVRFNLGVMVASNPPVTDDGVVVRQDLELADKSFRWRRPLGETQVVAATSNPATVVRQDLAAVFGEAQASIPSTSVLLQEDMVFDAETSYLEKWNVLLQVAGIDQVTTSEDTGRPRSVLLSGLAAKKWEWRYGPGGGKIVPAGRVEPLIDITPNVVVFSARQGPSLPEEGNGWRTVRNPSTGPASIAARGEEVVRFVPVAAENQQQLDAVAAAEAQRWFAGGGLRFSGRVGFNPLHGERDVVSLTRPRFAQAGVDVSGDWLVTEWRLPLRKVSGPDDVTMAVTCEKRVAVAVGAAA